MPRWAPDAFERLQDAAFDLFAEQGFERTTIAEIVSRAGLTSRTFFNHFADKREVLFGLSGAFEQLVAGEIAAGDDALPPLEVVVRALQAAADSMFEPRRELVRRRHLILDASPELQERELSKRSSLTEVVTAALTARGAGEDTARMAAGAAMLVWQTAERQWARPGEQRALRELLSEALRTLRTTAAH